MAKKGHWENKFMGRNPDTGRAYYERVWVDDSLLEEGPPAFSDEMLASTTADKPKPGEVVREVKGPVTFIDRIAQALEAAEDRAAANAKSGGKEKE